MNDVRDDTDVIGNNGFLFFSLTLFSHSQSVLTLVHDNNIPFRTQHEAILWEVLGVKFWQVTGRTRTSLSGRLFLSSFIFMSFPTWNIGPLSEFL
jgi:hypothetical protein